MNEMQHNENDYESSHFDVIAKMEKAHFWYIGRHALVTKLLEKYSSHTRKRIEDCKYIDVGGGCGGWVGNLLTCGRLKYGEITLGDSSSVALEYARRSFGENVKIVDMNILKPASNACYDIVTLLDVIEHIEDHRKALTNALELLYPHGLIVLTVPALNVFWSYNDELIHHKRRYSLKDINTIAEDIGCNVLDSGYFMFSLSPLIWLARRKKYNIDELSVSSRNALLAKTHGVPMGIVNKLLSGLLILENHIAMHIKWPWGASLYAVLSVKSEDGAS